MSQLKILREEKKITQKQAAEMLGISLRSYKSYENDSKKENTLKYNYLLQKITEYNLVNETTGILEIDRIKEVCAEICKKYDVEFCFLFGSYSKGTARQDSDVDLLISTNISGLKYYGMVEEFRERLKKRVDVLSITQLKDNYELTVEILRDGVRIYG